MKQLVSILLALSSLRALALDAPPYSSLWPSDTNAPPVTVGWNASPSSGVTNYTAWITTNAAFYSGASAPPAGITAVPVGTNLSCTFSNLAGGVTYYIAINCSGNGLNSAFSNIVPYPAPILLLPPLSNFFQLNHAASNAPPS